MKKIIAVIITVILLSGFTVRAENPVADGYSENYRSFFENGIEEYLDRDTKEKLFENGISPESYDWVNKINIQNIFSFGLSFIKGEIKKPLSAFASIISLILIISVINAFGSEKTGNTASVTATAVIALIISTDVFSCVSAAANGIKLCSGFMIGFIPIFSVLTSVTGKVLTAVSSSTVLLFAANAVSAFASYGVLPLMGGYLSVSIAGGVFPFVSGIDLAGTIKKITVWMLSLISTVFLGVLSVQSAVNSAADNLTAKTAKFILGTSVPIAGGILSEAASTVTASLSLLRSSVGIYAVVAVAVIMLPVITDILLWRLCFAIGGAVGELLGEKKIPSLLKAVDSVLACLLGITILVISLFIISLTVLVSAGKSV